MPLGSLVCGLLITISVNYLMAFLYLQRGLESRRCRPCREISYIRFTHIIRVPVFVSMSMSIHWRSPPTS